MRQTGPGEHDRQFPLVDLVFGHHYRGQFVAAEVLRSRRSGTPAPGRGRAPLPRVRPRVRADRRRSRRCRQPFNVSAVQVTVHLPSGSNWALNPRRNTAARRALAFHMSAGDISRSARHASEGNLRANPSGCLEVSCLTTMRLRDRRGSRRRSTEPSCPPRAARSRSRLCRCSRAERAAARCRNPPTVIADCHLGRTRTCLRCEGVRDTVQAEKSRSPLRDLAGAC